MAIPAEHVVKWGIARRLAFIDFRLYWERRINRSDLIEFFGISLQQASADLQEYIRLTPSHVEYDKSAKTYLATGEFAPKFVPADPRSYLDQLASLEMGLLDRGSSFIGTVPSFAAIDIPRRHIEPQILMCLLDALKNRFELDIQYQSMSSPDLSWRRLSPHALASDGLRWHVRGYCHKRQEFRDFVLARIVALGESRKSEIDPSTDEKWHKYVVVRFGPHPKLTEAQRKAIGREFEMENGEKTIRVREALAFYLLQRLGLDKASEAKPPEARQIVLLNPAELETYR